MTDEELIKHVLCDYPIYYLMYPGGTGGEFLSNLISIYSNKFRSKVSENIKVDDKNRTFVWLLPFFQTVASCRLKSPSDIINGIDELINVLKEQHNFLNLNIKVSTSQAINYLTKEEKPPLLRCHVSTNSYFHNNNTYLILADNKKWHEYKEILIFLKALLNKHYCPTDNEKIKFFEYERSTSISNLGLYNIYTDALEWTIKNNISDLYGIQLDVIKHTYLLKNKITASFQEIFSTDPITLFKKYNHVMCDFESEYNFRYSRFNGKVISIIKYSKIFKKGYLEKMFNIESDEFHEKLIEWHERNLELMSINNFDHTKYKL
jgi:hypothetical protein